VYISSIMLVRLTFIQVSH